MSTEVFTYPEVRLMETAIAILRIAFLEHAVAWQSERTAPAVLTLAGEYYGFAPGAFSRSHLAAYKLAKRSSKSRAPGTAARTALRMLK